MRIDKFLPIIVLLCLIILQTNSVFIHAQGPDEEDFLVITPSGQLNLTFKQLGYENEGLNRDRSVSYYNIDLPGNFQISSTDNYLALVTSHLPEIPDKPASLIIKMNGYLVSSFLLTKENAMSDTVRVELDEGILRVGRNSIAVSLDTGDTCEDPAGNLDVLIHDTSVLNFGYEQNPYPADLALYPFPFTEQSLLKIPVTIVLPAQPTSNELSTAAIIAAGLGQMSGGTIDLTTVSVNNLTPDIQENNHLIVIGQPDTNELLNDLDLPIPIDNTTLKPGQGILQEVVSPWNEFRLILVVSSLDGEGQLKAALALNRQAHFLGMRGPVAIVVELGSPSASVTSDTSLTLASLGYDDVIIYGTLPQEQRFEFFLPLGWRLNAHPSFMLKFTHANIISPESVINVELNGEPIGSTLLNDSNAAEGQLAIALPEHLLKSGRNRLQVATEMELLDVDECTALEDERAWAVISSMSEFLLTYDIVNPPPDLAFFPHPFNVGQTVFVVPDQPSSDIIDELIQLAVRVGAASKAKEDILMQVSYASKVDQNVQQNYHLILVGRPTENSLLANINAYLPQPFEANSNLLKPLAVDNVAFSSDPERDAGLLQIIVSPWNEEKTLLAVTGTTDEGVGLAGQALLEQTEQFKGNLAVVEPVFDPFTNEAPYQISIYSVDTRPLAANQDLSAIESSVSQKDQSTLANRWWR